MCTRDLTWLSGTQEFNGFKILTEIHTTPFPVNLPPHTVSSNLIANLYNQDTLYFFQRQNPAFSETRREQ